MRPAVSLITLGVADLETSLKFYRDGLGWSTTSTVKDGVIFIQLQNLVLALWSKDQLAEDANVPADGGGFPGFSLAQNVESKLDVDSVMETARRAGAAIMKPAKDTFWGGYSGYFADPDGYLWEVAWNPHWGIDKNGGAVLGK